MHVCDGNVGATMMKQQVIEVVHSQNVLAVNTISFESRMLHTVNMGRAEFAISHIRNTRDSEHDEAAQLCSMFVHMAGDTLHTLSNKTRAGVATR